MYYALFFLGTSKYVFRVSDKWPIIKLVQSLQNTWGLGVCLIQVVTMVCKLDQSEQTWAPCLKDEFWCQSWDSYEVKTCLHTAVVWKKERGISGRLTQGLFTENSQSSKISRIFLSCYFYLIRPNCLGPLGQEKNSGSCRFFQTFLTLHLLLPLQVSALVTAIDKVS